MAKWEKIKSVINKLILSTKDRDAFFFAGMAISQLIVALLLHLNVSPIAFIITLVVALIIAIIKKAFKLKGVEGYDAEDIVAALFGTAWGIFVLFLVMV